MRRSSSLLARYSIEPRDQIFVTGYRFLSFAKSIWYSISKNLAVNTVKSFFIELNKLHHIHLKLLQKDQFKKQQKQPVI